MLCWWREMTECSLSVCLSGGRLGDGDDEIGRNCVRRIEQLDCMLLALTALAPAGRPLPLDVWKLRNDNRSNEVLLGAVHGSLTRRTRRSCRLSTEQNAEICFDWLMHVQKHTRPPSSMLRYQKQRQWLPTQSTIKTLSLVRKNKYTAASVI